MISFAVPYHRQVSIKSVVKLKLNSVALTPQANYTD
jgi:hypothetical protein